MADEDVAPRIGALLGRLADGSSDADGIRTALFDIAYGRMQSLGSRMIRGFPHVRRWSDTADVVQAAALRLHRALADVDLRDPRHVLRLAALQIRRELLDLARKYASPESFAAHHETNALATADGIVMQVDRAADPSAVPADGLESWSRLHDAVASLPDEDRELFDLVWFMGATQHDIAALTGSSPRTVRRRWDEIKRRLVAVLDGDMPTA
jgi:RNA polymerase sigma-70 factor (ECF subfamily)